jgi:hypothetical protein
MYYVLLVLGIIYGSINIFAGFMQLKQKQIALWSSSFMIGSGILMILASILSDKSFYYFYMLLGSILLIHIAAIANGFKLNNKLNYRHHIIRLLISIILIVLYLV